MALFDVIVNYMLMGPRVLGASVLSRRDEELDTKCREKLASSVKFGESNHYG